MARFKPSELRGRNRTLPVFRNPFLEFDVKLFRRKKTSSSTYLAAWKRACLRYRNTRETATTCAFCHSLRQRIGALIHGVGDRIERFSLKGDSIGDGVQGAVTEGGQSNDYRSWAEVARALARSFIPWLRSIFGRGSATEGGGRIGQGDGDYGLRGRGYAGPGNRRYRGHVPANYTGRTAVPVIMILHGCRQTHADIQHIADFDRLADKHGFLAVYPYVTSYSGLRNRNCWGWWLREHVRAGAGEVEDLWQILREVQANYRVDNNRVHVAGLSSGAGMSVALMVARATKIASGAAVAGVPYGETARAVGFVRHITGHFRPVNEIVREMEAAMGEKKRLVPLFVVHSLDDATVNIQAARNLRDSWAHCFDVPLHRRVTTRKGAVGATRWEHTRYRGERRHSTIETLFLEGPGHGWYGGRPGRYSYPQAPDTAEWLWRFFQSHPMKESVTETTGVEPVVPTTPEGEPRGNRWVHEER